jgi:glycosyltransferase involved in cell wall biosynthesis
MDDKKDVLNKHIPKVSIGMPVYNGKKYIREALDSLLAQTFTDFELIISDNASTDGTEDICREYVKKDSRVRYVRQSQNMRAVWNFNFVLEEARGEYFMWASHDDCWNSRYLRVCFDTFDRSSKIVLVSTFYQSVNPQSGKLLFTDTGVTTTGLNSSERFRKYMLSIHGSVGGLFFGLYKRDALKFAMYMKRVIAFDHIILFKLSLLGEFVTLQESYATKRKGGDSSDYKKFVHNETHGQGKNYLWKFPLIRAKSHYTKNNLSIKGINIPRKSFSFPLDILLLSASLRKK